MATRVASLYAEIGSETSGLKKGLKEAQAGLKDTAKTADKSGASLKGMWGTATKALGAVAAFGVAAKKAFDLGKEGAQLEYVADKFDRLSTSAGTFSELLLTKLRAATKGTRSDAELMAGASDLMALGLAKSSDEVVRLTRVVGGLNMDMNQLVLTLTNQTTMRFDALGVSVDGFDDKVKKLKATGMDANKAFTEAFLQQAEEQLAKVGDAADTNAGSIARMEASVANLADSFKLKLAPAVASTADAINDLLQGKTTPEKNREELDKVRETVFETAGSYDEYATAMIQAGIATRLLTEESLTFDLTLESGRKHREGVLQYIGALSKAQWEATRTSNAMVKGMANAEMRGRSYSTAVDTAANSLKELNNPLEDVTRKMSGYGDIVEKAIPKTYDFAAAEAEAYRNARNWKSGLGETVSLLDRLNTMDLNFGDKIKAELDQMAWDAAGGDVIQQAGGRINKALEAGKITPAQAEEMLKELAIASDTLAADINKTDFNTLAQALVDDLHIPLDEAKTKAQEAIEAIKAGALEKYIYTIEIRYNDGGYHPAWEGKQTQGITVSPGDGSGRGNQGTPKASGGAVNIGTSYMVGERGPEMFTPGASGYITPNHALGGGDTYVTNNIYQLPGEDTSALAARVVAMLSRGGRRGAAGLGYAGA